MNVAEVDYTVALIMGCIEQQFDESGHKSEHKAL
jgi:hypothetical protein